MVKVVDREMKKKAKWLIGGHINYNDNHEKIFNFITAKGTFTYNEATDEFKSKLQIR